MDIEQYLTKISENARSDDPFYIKDGIEYCRKCNSPRQKMISLTIKGEKKDILVNMMCKCRAKEVEEEENRRKQAQQEAEIQRNISIGIKDMSYRSMTFEKSDTRLIREENYCRNFPKMQEMKVGIMFSGEAGTGKTFRAAAIGNQLLRNGYTVYMNNITAICNELWGLKDKQQAIDNICSFELMILDDIGAERSTEYMSELVYNIIDTRYRSGKPLIITTNLKNSEIKALSNGEQINGSNTTPLSQSRIYSRIVEMCSYPIIVSGRNRRGDIGRSKYETVKELLENGL